MNKGLATLELAVQCGLGNLFGLVREVRLLLGRFSFLRPRYGPVVEVPFYSMWEPQ